METLGQNDRWPLHESGRMVRFSGNLDFLVLNFFEELRQVVPE